MSHKIPKRCFFPAVHFSNDLRQNVLIWIAPTYRWDPYENFGVWKRLCSKTCRSTSNEQIWASWFVKKWILWWCGIGLNILLPTAVPVVCLSYCRPHGLEYHYDFTVSDHTNCVIPQRHKFGLLSHHGRLGAGGPWRKSPLDGATNLLSKLDGVGPVDNRPFSDKLHHFVRGKKKKMWHVTRDMWHVTCDTWHVTHDTWHVTRDKWHVTHLGGWTLSQNFSSLALTVCDLWYYEELEEKAHLNS